MSAAETLTPRERIERFFEGETAPFGVYREGRIRRDLRADIEAVLAELDAAVSKAVAQ